MPLRIAMSCQIATGGHSPRSKVGKVSVNLHWRVCIVCKASSKQGRITLHVFSIEEADEISRLIALIGG